MITLNGAESLHYRLYVDTCERSAHATDYFVVTIWDILYALDNFVYRPYDFPLIYVKLTVTIYNSKTLRPISNNVIFQERNPGIFCN